MINYNNTNNIMYSEDSLSKLIKVRNEKNKVLNILWSDLLKIIIIIIIMIRAPGTPTKNNKGYLYT